MLRTMMEQNRNEIKGVNKNFSKGGDFQKNLTGKINKVLRQRVGEVKNTLPIPKIIFGECNKKVADKDLCAIVHARYNSFYNEVCTVSPALCDDIPPTPISQIQSRPSMPQDLPAYAPFRRRMAPGANDKDIVV